MYPTPDRFLQLGKSSIEAALTVATITLQSTERLIDLNLKTAREVLDEGLRNAKTLAEAKSVQELASLRPNGAQPGVDKAIEYSRGLYEVASKAQGEIQKVLEEQYTRVSSEMLAALEQAAKIAPAGAEPAVAAFKSALAMANSAYDAFAKAARQAAEAAVDTSTQEARNTKKRTH